MIELHARAPRQIAFAPPVIPAGRVLLTAMNPMNNTGNVWHVGLIHLYRGETTRTAALNAKAVINGAEVSVFTEIVDGADYDDGSPVALRVCWFGTSSAVTSAYVDLRATFTIARATGWTTRKRVPDAVLWPDAVRMCHAQRNGWGLKTLDEALNNSSVDYRNMIAAYQAAKGPDHSMFPALQDSRTAYYYRASHGIEYSYMNHDASDAMFMLTAYTVGSFLGYASALDYAMNLCGPEWIPGPRDLKYAYDISGNADWKTAIGQAMLWFGFKVTHNGSPSWGGGGYIGPVTPLTYGGFYTGYGDHRTTSKWVESMVIGTQIYSLDLAGGVVDGWRANGTTFLSDMALLLNQVNSDGFAGGFSYTGFADITIGSNPLVPRVNTAYNSFDAQVHLNVGDLAAIPSGASMPNDGTRRYIVVDYRTNGTTYRVDAAAAVVNNFNGDMTSAANFAGPANIAGYNTYCRVVIVAEAGKAYVANSTPLTDSGIGVWFYASTDVQYAKCYMTQMLMNQFVFAHQHLPASQSSLKTSIMSKLQLMVTWIMANGWDAATNGYYYITGNTVGSGNRFNQHGGDGNRGSEPSLANFGLESLGYVIQQTGDQTHAAKLQGMLRGAYSNRSQYNVQPKQFDEAMMGVFRTLALVPL